MDFDYKKYSLEKLNEWMHDALSCSEASPQEIYDVIKGVVDENYHIYKNHTERCYELLALLNGNGKGHIKAYDDYIDDGMKPWGHSDLEFGLANPTLTEDRISNFPGENSVCNKNDSSPECKSSWVDFWNDSPDYFSTAYENFNQFGVLKGGNSEDVITFGEPKKDKVVKWQLPVEADGPSGEYFVTFPDDLLEAANLKANDLVEWVDQGDGSYLLRKV